MRWVLIGLLLAGVAFLLLGRYAEESAADGAADDAAASAIPYLIGVVLIGSDLVVGVAYAVIKAVL